MGRCSAAMSSWILAIRIVMDLAEGRPVFSDKILMKNQNANASLGDFPQSSLNAS
jgi:hypothetical protein